MLRPLAFVSPFLLLLVAILPASLGGGPKKDAKELQGAWELTELIVAGVPVAEKDIKGLRFVFKADKLTIIPPPPDTSTIPRRVFVILGVTMGSHAPPPRVVDDRFFSVKVDVSKQPATVDLTALDGPAKGTVSPGIFEIKGDVLRWCQSDDPKNMQRPTSFASPEKSRQYLFTFKRAK